MALDNVIALVAGILGGFAWQAFWNRVQLPKHKKLAALQAVQEYKAEQAKKRHADHFHGEIGKLMGMPVFRSPLVPPNDIILMNSSALPDFFKQEVEPQVTVRIGSDVEFPPPDNNIMDEVRRQSEAWMVQWVRDNAETLHKPPSGESSMSRFINLGDEYSGFIPRGAVPDEFKATSWPDSPPPFQVDRKEVKPDVPEVHRPDSSTGDSGGSDTL